MRMLMGMRSESREAGSTEKLVYTCESKILKWPFHEADRPSSPDHDHPTIAPILDILPYRICSPYLEGMQISLLSDCGRVVVLSAASCPPSTSFPVDIASLWFNMPF